MLHSPFKRLEQQTGTEVKVFLNTNTDQTTFARATVVFNPSQLQLADTITRGLVFGYEVSKTAVIEANSTGRMSLVYLRCAPTDRGCLSGVLPSGLFDVATLTFKPKTGFTTGSSSITVDTNDSQVVTVTGTKLPLAVTPISLSFEAATAAPTKSPSSVPSPTTVATSSPAPTQTTSFKAEYFNNKTLSGAPVVTRNETTVQHEWKLAAPAPGVTPDNFSARFSQNAQFTSGLYRFTLVADDGIRLFVDGVKIIDGWKDQSATTYTADINLTSGTHSVVVEYYEGGWDATAKAMWTKQQNEDTTFKAEYFSNKTLSGTPIVRQESAINFDWGYGGPIGIPKDNFSARFSRSVYFQAGTYRFTVTVDDAARILVDGKVIIDQWKDQRPTTYTKDLILTEGLHSVQMYYAEAFGTAIAKFNWIKR